MIIVLHFRDLYHESPAFVPACGTLFTAVFSIFSAIWVPAPGACRAYVVFDILQSFRMCLSFWFPTAVSPVRILEQNLTLP